MPHGTAYSAGSAAGCHLETTSFVGRDRVLADLLAAIAERRLTTLWGAAGVGKTRLLRRACAETTARGRVTVVEVMDLLPARDRAALVAAVAQALGISLATVHEDAAIEHVGRALALSGEMLLALDGLEHLLPHADVLATWLDRAPALRVLCTSRTPLALPGEHALELEGLSQASGVALFEDRLRALTGATLPSDAQATANTVVDLVAGLPLAIELMAARAARDGIATVAHQLSRAMSPRPSARPAVMAATVEVALAHATSAEREALERLACCADAVALEVARQVVGEPAAEERLEALTKLALTWVRHGRHGELRVGCYSSVREALERRAGRPLDAVAQHAHVLASWCAPFATRARAGDGDALQALLDDGPNVDVALAHSVHHGDTAALAVATGTMAIRRGARDAHEAALERGLHAARAAGLRVAELELVERRATLADAAGALSSARGAHDDARALAEQLGDAGRAAAARAQVGFARFQLGEREAGLQELDQAIGAAPGNSAALALAHNRRGVALLSSGDRRGLDDLVLAAALAARAGDATLRVATLVDVARAHRTHGAVEIAARHLLEAMAPGRPLSDELRARALGEQAALARINGRHDDAAALVRDALVAAEACGVPAALVSVHVIASEIALDRGAQTSALQHAEHAAAVAARLEAPVHALEAQLARARALRAGGDTAGARSALAAIACGLAVCADRQVVGLLALERALLEGEPDGSAPQMRRDLAAAATALLPQGGRLAALALALRALLDPDQADRAALVRAASEQPDAELGALLALVRGDDDDERFFLVRRVSPLRRAPARREMVVGTDGRYYEIDGRRTSLARQRSLRLIFLALVDEAERRPGHGLRQPEVLARGWPGEKMRPDSGATRVYTSIRRLRRGGLEGVLVTRDDGYLIDPQVTVRRALLAQ